MNDRNSKDWDTKTGKASAGIKIPTNKLFEKSGTGNKRNQPINPIIIEIYAVFSFNLLL